MEIVEFAQRRRQSIPVQLEVMCATTADIFEFNTRLNPILIKYIERETSDNYKLRADRTGQDGCYSARNPITYWSIIIPKGWFKRQYIGEIVTERLLSGRLRLRFHILQPYWSELEQAVNAIYNEMLSSSEGFGVVTPVSESNSNSPTRILDEKITVLFLAASPEDEDRLRVDREVRAIDASLVSSKLHNRFDIQPYLAVQASDFQSSLLRFRPHIVHFSGHGTRRGELIVENDFGDGQPVPPEGLGKLLGILQDRIQCVILNACHSAKQADEIAKHIHK